MLRHTAHGWLVRLARRATVFHSALNYFKELELWDDVVNCYQLLSKPQRAEVRPVGRPPAPRVAQPGPAWLSLPHLPLGPHAG